MNEVRKQKPHKEKNPKKIMWVTAIIPLIITAAVLQFMPDLVPMHYDTAGNIDRWGNKNENYIFCLMIIGLTIFWHFLIRYYEKKAEQTDDRREQAVIASNSNVLKKVVIIQNILFSIQQYCILFQAYKEATATGTGSTLQTDKMIYFSIGVMFVLVGNYMSRTKRNALVGFRIKWSMYNDITWQKSNFVAAIAVVAAGLVTMITSTILQGNLILMLLTMTYLFIALAVSLIYAYKVYCEEQESDTEKNELENNNEL